MLTGADRDQIQEYIIANIPVYAPLAFFLILSVLSLFYLLIWVFCCSCCSCCCECLKEKVLADFQQDPKFKQTNYEGCYRGNFTRKYCFYSVMLWAIILLIAIGVWIYWGYIMILRMDKFYFTTSTIFNYLLKGVVVLGLWRGRLGRSFIRMVGKRVERRIRRRRMVVKDIKKKRI